MNFERIIKLIEETFSAAWKSPAKDIILEGGQIPLTPQISSILGWNIPMKAFHFTNTPNIMNVVKSKGNRRRQISTTTKFPKEFRGVLKTGHSLLISGNALFGNTHDVGSGPDHSGMRWVPLDGFLKGGMSKYEIKTELFNVLNRIYQDNSDNVGNLMKELVWFVKEYKEFFPTPEYVKGTDDDYSIDGYNEIILDKFRIEKALINLQYVKNEDIRILNQTISLLKLNKIPFEIFKESEDFYEANQELEG